MTVLQNHQRLGEMRIVSVTSAHKKQLTACVFYETVHCGLVSTLGWLASTSGIAGLDVSGPDCFIQSTEVFF